MSGDSVGDWIVAFVRDPAFHRQYPYYAAVLARLAPVADPSVHSMAVSFERGKFYLHVNADYFVRAPQFLRGILLHEVHHVVLGHLTHPKFFDAEHPDLMELAEEISANEHIEEPLPNPYTVAMFETCGLKRGQSTLDRYELLVRAREAGQKLGRGDARAVDDHEWKLGEPSPPGGVEHTRQLVEASIETVEREREEREGESKRPLLAGREPGRIVEDLVGVTGPPETFVDWKTALRAFAAQARTPIHTWSRPSRRFPHRAFEVPGRVWSRRPIHRPHLVVAIDTSMSMNERELSEIARQLVPVAEHARVTVVECDVEIQNVHAFEGSLPRVKGRGGTDLRVVFERAFLSEHRPDGVVYFTDGQGPTPDEAPDIPVLWVLTKPLAFECPFGSRAKLERAAEAPRASRMARAT